MDSSRDVDPGRLAERMEALPGLARLREAAGGSAYLVGGAVRDLLLGAPRADLDVAVEGDVGELARKLGGELHEHDRFATATVRDGELSIDLATSRAESYASPGALPEVRPAPIAEDLARRDFTINAMAVPLAGEPELLDPHRGVEDLRAGLLRVLHSESFADDPTRALRAARYAGRLGLELEPETETWLRAADLSTVSDDRVEAELRRIAAEQNPGSAYALVRDWGLVDSIDARGPEHAAKVAALAAEPPWAGWVDRERAVRLAIVSPLRAVSELAAADPGRASEAVRLARAADPTELLVARAIGGGEWLDRYASEWRQIDLEISGEDLISAGIEEGPAVGLGLQAALDAKLDGELSGREAELAAALEAAREGG